MTTNTPSSVDLHDLTDAITGYGKALGTGRGFRPERIAEAEAYFASVPDPNVAGNHWAWACVVAGWPGWRPHRLERRLVLPNSNHLARAAAACRAWPAEKLSRRWSPFSRSEDGDGLKEVLGEAAELLEAGREPEPATLATLDLLVPLARRVDDAIEHCGAGWVPGRIASLALRLAATAKNAPHPFPIPTGPFRDVIQAACGPVVEGDADAKVWWATWFGKEGGDWFHDLATLAVLCPETGHALAAVCLGAGVDCYPCVMPETATVLWPVETTELPTDFGFSLGLPAGAIGAVERFATSPQSARFAILTGTDQSSPLATAASIWQEVRGAEFTGLRVPLRQAIANSIRTGNTPTCAEILAVLDELPRVEGRTLEQTDRILALIRNWTQTGGWFVLPLPGMSTDENCLLKPVFKRDTAAGTIVRIKTFGLSGPEGVIRPAEIVVSAGPPPHGFTELEAAIATAPGNSGEALRDAFRGLREAGACGYLEPAAVDVYKLFWDRARSEWEAADPSATAAFASGLLAMLGESFGLSPLEPTHYRDHPPEWAVLLPGTRMVTGRVTKVLRPGLTANGVLRLPAVIEAE